MSERSYSFLNITAAGLVKRGSGVLHTVTINKPPNVGGNLTLYDNASAAGTVIAIIQLGNVADSVVNPSCFVFDAQVSTGIYAATSELLSGFNVTLTFA